MIKLGDWQWYDFESLVSTNDYGIAQADTIIPSQKIIYTAQEQTGGRGRRGRTWVSPKGNLYLSQLFFSSKQPAEIAYITAVSIAQTIESFAPNIVPQIKWPNDIIINGKKVGGILIEKSLKGAYVIGIGINLESAPNLNIIYPAASLKDFQVIILRDDFIKRYLSFFESNIIKDFVQIKNNFIKKAYKLNEDITVSIGDKKIMGQFIGIDENGFLLLKQGKSVTVINTGEILCS